VDVGVEDPLEASDRLVVALPLVLQQADARDVVEVLRIDLLQARERARRTGRVLHLDLRAPDPPEHLRVVRIEGQRPAVDPQRVLRAVLPLVHAPQLEQHPDPIASGPPRPLVVALGCLPVALLRVDSPEEGACLDAVGIAGEVALEGRRPLALVPLLNLDRGQEHRDVLVARVLRENLPVVARGVGVALLGVGNPASSVRAFRLSGSSSTALRTCSAA
jgi:hypothetical protein